MSKVHNNLIKPNGKKRSIIQFWIPLTILTVITILAQLIRDNRPLGWVLLVMIIVVTVALRKTLLRIRILPGIASWVLIITLLFLTVIWTGPVIENKPVWTGSGESVSTEAIETQDGLVAGIYNKDKSVRVFAGIPYAAPPIGDLRWKAPQPVQPWDGVLQLERFSDAEMQSRTPNFLKSYISLRLGTSEFLDNFGIENNEKMSEDSLYLNVWSNAKSNQEKQPVMVFIHGGAYKNGSGSMDLYNGENMAQKGVLFVTINYRLGIFGFMANPELTEESDYGASGNYGILDQIAALKWVKNNIESFGGDPDNVTIAGESAGAGSVNILTASPLAKGLFNKAIAESGAAFDAEGEKSGGISSQTLAQAEQQGVEFQASLNKASIKEMRQMPAEELLDASSAETIAPVIDGYVLPDTVYNIFEAGQQNDVPTLVGSNADEGSLLTLPWPLYAIEGADKFQASVRERFGDKADEVLQLYPASNDSEAKQAQLDLSTDKLFTWQMHTWAQLQNQTGNSRVYYYYFDKGQPGPSRFTQLGAYHFGEIVYAYNNLDKVNLPYTSVDRDVADRMSSYWVNFAKNGDPNSNMLPPWTPFDAATDQVMVLGEETGMTEMPRKMFIEFFDNYERNLRASFKN
ncbi:carboxylesterase/lipase family protein [Paenibacillus monticola]|uniref:carboxylesterase/lipase family protein n=1 Tax=Paenibacillus monticola TaxID=2666075 RepID=UPI00189DD0AA|nr:carboxylesterase family protein [Paenibacillus monticola]